MFAFLALLLLALFNEGGIARPFGAPCEALISMTPAAAAHGDPNQFTPPYVVEFLNPGSETEPECYRANRNYLIRIRSTDGSTFSGFILQCRDTNDIRFGTFLSGSGNGDLWQYQCRKPDSITHIRPMPKQYVNAMWRPNGFAGEFTCKATVLQSLYVWWPKIPSRTLRPCAGEEGNAVPFADAGQQRWFRRQG